MNPAQSGIKVALTKDPVTGEQCVPPAVMDLLLRYGEHRQLCDQCRSANERGVVDFCETGHALLFELSQQPEVTKL